MTYAIVLSGGVGSRFWPLSRESNPKQFLNICSAGPLIDETLQRVSRIVKKDNIFIAASLKHKAKINNCIRSFGIPLRNILFEPQPKNTLAPIAVLSNVIYNSDKDAVIAVLPADHFIQDANKFLRIFRQGINAAKDGCIVTFGIKPTRPENGYGYIKVSSKFIVHGSKLGYRVGRFIEKPDLLKAKKFISDRRYYWNSGIFIFKAKVMLDEVKKLNPAAYKIITAMSGKTRVNKLWPKLPAVSIDYAVMQKTKRIILIPFDCGWTDLGSWQSIGEVIKKDSDRNIFRGDCIDIGSKNSLVWSGERLVATLGLEDIVVVDTDDALLVCHKERAQDVKEIVEILRQRNLGNKI